jgi:acetyltransferase
VDARVILKPSKIESPLHLVISPYPAQYEMSETTKGGVHIFIRPIKPEDEPLLAEFFKTLSSESVYMRFFSPMKSIPHAMMARFTQIDYDRDMALVAMGHDQPKEEILGVARLMSKPGGIEPEFSVVVSDVWQGKGIGAALMAKLMAIAKEKGMTSVWGLILAENTQMLALARKFDASVRHASGNQCELRIELKRHRPSKLDNPEMRLVKDRQNREGSP